MGEKSWFRPSLTMADKLYVWCWYVCERMLLWDEIWRFSKACKLIRTTTLPGFSFTVDTFCNLKYTHDTFGVLAEEQSTAATGRGFNSRDKYLYSYKQFIRVWVLRHVDLCVCIPMILDLFLVWKRIYKKKMLTVQIFVYSMWESNRRQAFAHCTIHAIR